MNYLKITLGIFIVLATSRFIPHPPNFTSLIALSFYVPLFLGKRFIPALLICFIITDIFIGFHAIVVFTWGSIIFISLTSYLFQRNIYMRIIGAVCGSLVFYIISNFGVWSLGSYGYSFNGLLICYIAAIPFYSNTLISTILYSALIEAINSVYKRYNLT
tara:strand:- start:8555 stop:9034 length:480 start_codon:yes stop_codon:yes gene_type:complete